MWHVNAPDQLAPAPGLQGHEPNILFSFCAGNMAHCGAAGAAEAALCTSATPQARLGQRSCCSAASHAPSRGEHHRSVAPQVLML
eukprot:gene16559-biopygen21805